MRVNEKHLATAAAILLAASCSGVSDEKAVVDACVQEGQTSEEGCECVAKELKKNLSADDYAAYAEISKKQLELSRKGAATTVEEAMEAGDAALGQLLSQPERMERIISATLDSGLNCAEAANSAN